MLTNRSIGRHAGVLCPELASHGCDCTELFRNLRSYSRALFRVIVLRPLTTKIAEMFGGPVIVLSKYSTV